MSGPEITAPERPRLVATDLDGTLAGADGRVTAHTAAVLASVEAQGIPVVFVTGRPLRWARDVFEHVGAAGLAIVSNGALVWDVAADTALLRRPIEHDVVRSVCADLRAAVPGSTFALEDGEGIMLEPGFMERHPIPPGARRGTLDELLAGSGPVLKLLARHEDLTHEEYWAAADRVAGDRVTITWASSTTLLEISALGVTKATTLALVADRLGVRAADVMAFGDMPNDLPMLAWAGTSYAMANAHPTVLAAVDRVAPSNLDDGVAAVLAEVIGA